MKKLKCPKCGSNRIVIPGNTMIAGGFVMVFVGAIFLIVYPPLGIVINMGAFFVILYASIKQIMSKGAGLTCDDCKNVFNKNEIEG